MAATNSSPPFSYKTAFFFLVAMMVAAVSGHAAAQVNPVLVARMGATIESAASNGFRYTLRDWNMNVIGQGVVKNNRLVLDAKLPLWTWNSKLKAIPIPLPKQA